MVLMQMVMTQQMVGMRADTRGVEVFEDESVKVGKKTCTCSFSFTMAGNKVKKALGTCDKKCSGNVKKLSLNNDDWSFTFGFGDEGGGRGEDREGGAGVLRDDDGQGGEEVPQEQEQGWQAGRLGIVSGPAGCGCLEQQRGAQDDSARGSLWDHLVHLPLEEAVPPWSSWRPPP